MRTSEGRTTLSSYDQGRRAYAFWVQAGAGLLAVLVGAPSCSRDDGRHKTTELSHGCEGDSVHDWATYSLLGLPGTDNQLGYKTAVGDVDGDRRDDILVAGYNSPYAYLVLGSTLSRLGPATCNIADVADHAFALNGWQISGDGDYGNHNYSGYDVGVHMESGQIFIGNPVVEDSSIPIAYRIQWSTLEEVGPGVHDLSDVADVRFKGNSYLMGESIQLCDVNADGEQDLLLGAGFNYTDSTPAYLALGPWSVGTVDLDKEASLMYYVDFPYQGACKVGACTDYNGDSFEDFSLTCREPSTGESVVGIVYGSASIGSGGMVDLSAFDVTVRLHESGASDVPYVFSTHEAVGDLTGDGNSDLVVNSYYGYSEVTIFSGAVGFYPSGTTLNRDDRLIGLTDLNDSSLGSGASILGDLDGDGVTELVLGQSGANEGAGLVYISRSSPEPGDYGVEAVADTTLEGAEGAARGEGLGASVLAAGDIDADGNSDLVISAPYWTQAEGYSGAVYVVISER